MAVGRLVLGVHLHENKKVATICIKGREDLPALHGTAVAMSPTLRIIKDTTADANEYQKGDHSSASFLLLLFFWPKLLGASFLKFIESQGDRNPTRG